MQKLVIHPIDIMIVLTNKDHYNTSNIRPPDITPEIYNNWVNKFSFEKWYSGLLEAQLIKLTSYDKEILIELSKKVILRGRKLKMDDLMKFNMSFIREIRSALALYNHSVFVKTSEKSGKNDSDVEPSSTVLDIIKGLTNSKDIYLYSLTRQDSCNYIIIQPWNDRITKQNEFRVIIENKRILGISQQRIYQNVDLTTELCIRAGNSIQKWYNNIKDSIPFDSVVLDLFVDFEDSNTVNLIECNPGYCWGSSGSALFNWIYDKVFLDSPDIYFRYDTYF